MLITKEWFERQRPFFNVWYDSLCQISSSSEKGSSEPVLPIETLPVLPDGTLKIGAFVRKAMENLSMSGFEFSDDYMQALCSEDSMKTVVGLQRRLPFFKLYDPNEKDGHLTDGRPRFYSKP